MAALTVKTVAGKSAGTVELSAGLFGVQPNVPVMHQVVTAQLAHRRAGTQSTKTRAEVSGGGKKPYKQKGTGNARQGSTRAPHFSGGGIALGPKPRSYTQKVNKKVVRLGLASALSDRAAMDRVVVVDSWGLDAPKTKAAAAALQAIGVEGKVLVVLQRDDLAAIKSFRNLPGVQIIETAELNAYDVLCNDWIVFTTASLPGGADAPAATEASTTQAKAPKAPARLKKDAAADESAAVAVEAFADTSAAPPAEDAPTDVDAAPYGDGSHGPTADGSAPDGFDIKGNADSMLYHVPGSRFYKQTIAEVWFATEEAAEAAGFSKPASQQHDEEGE